MTILNPPDEATLTALGALNAWARGSDDGRIRRAIYWYKRNALAALHDAGVDLSPVPVYVDTQCRDCEGTGRYMGEWGQEDHCWRCESTGTVRLEFVQVTLPGGAIWHSPREPLKCPTALLVAVAGQAAIPAEDWEVGREGADLPYPDLAAALNRVEDWHGLPETYTIMWNQDDYQYYKLPLGERDQSCAFCGGPLEPDPVGYCASDRRLLTWRDWCCASCDKRWAPSFPPFPVPEELLSDPARIWLGRRKLWRLGGEIFSEKGEFHGE